MNLNDTEIFAEDLFQRVESLISERDLLRSELNRASEINIERDKAFVKAIHDSIIGIETISEQNVRLGHFLLMK